MAEDPKQLPPDDIQGILQDLDAILSDLGGSDASSPAAPLEFAAPAAPPPAPKAAEPPPPPKPAEPPPPPKPAEPPPAVVLPPAPAPGPASAPAAGAELKIELAPREGVIAPKKSEPPPPPKAAPPPPPPKPAEPAPAPKAAEPPPPPPKPAEPAPAPKAAEPPPPPPKPAEPAPAPKAAEPPPAVPAAAAAAVPDDIPEKTPKEQIRRVAYVYTFASQEQWLALSSFLSKAARSISKKPLFLRQCSSLEVTGASDPNAVFEQARKAQAVAVLAVVDGWPAAKVEALSEACSRGGMMFRSIPPGDVQKKSTAVDVIVDMMLLPGES